MAPRKKKTAAKKKTAKKATPIKASPAAVSVNAAVATTPSTGNVWPPIGRFEDAGPEIEALQSKDEAVRALMHSVNSEERRIIVYADEASTPYMLRRPTGIMELDIDLGGGFPAGGPSFVSGPDNAGKTWLILKTMAYQQRLHGNRCRLAFAHTEGPFPYDQAINAGLKIAIPDSILEQWQEWRRQRGMPLMNLEQLQAFKEKVGEFYLVRGETGEDVLQTIIDMVRINVFQLIGCDSVQGLRPTADADKDLTDNEKRAAHATMMGRFFHLYTPFTTGINGSNETTLLFSQQVRANQERANASANIQKYIKDWAVTGSRAAKHYKLIDLLLWSGSVIKKGEGKDRHAVGKELKWETEKGKAGTHDHKTGDVSFYYGIGGTDDIGELLASGIKRGVIGMMGKSIVVRRPDTGEILEDFTAPNQVAMRRMLENDFDFEMALRREILTAAGIQCLYL